ncbi:TPA: hypothetical protein ACHF82_000556 [Escherichia coli]
MSTGYTGMNHAGYGTLTDIDHLNQSITDIILTEQTRKRDGIVTRADILPAG